ncbi:MAG: hydroxyisourate hydrolase [Alphaproteobacteria bacterium]|nr:hydroxyisourate hydrolase [Alphaproteobacteria bacterium]
MALISSHTLNGVDGTHAAGVAVVLKNLVSGEILFETATDKGGRLAESVVIDGNDPAMQYELCFKVGPYWERRGCNPAPIAREVVFRFLMPVSSARYHIPVILSPNSYTCWVSNPVE